MIVGILTAYIVIVIQTVTSGVDFLIGYFNHSVAGAPVSVTITNDVFFFSLLLYILIFISMFTRRVNTSPGACDNGSGSAILLSLAAHYKEHPAQNLHMKFCWFAAEEWGLYGSKHYVADHKDEIVAQKDNSYLINVDMVGTELAYLDKAGMFIKNLSTGSSTSSSSRRLRKRELKCARLNHQWGTTAIMRPSAS